MTRLADGRRALRSRVQRRVLEDAAPGMRGAALQRRIARAVVEAAPQLDAGERLGMISACIDDITGLGPLEALLRDGSITEIMCNGRGVTYIERAGVLSPIDVDVDDAAVLRIAQRIIAPLDLRLDRTAPVVDARLPDGTRVHAIIPPLAVDGPVLTIRRFPDHDLALADFGVMCGAADLLCGLVRAGWNLLIAGGTSSGKTSLVNALSAAIPSGDRVVTIEETAELRLRCAHVVRLEARPANAEGVGAVSTRDLVRAALRMRPDRIIVGEARGAEAFDMVQAGNTGHDGSLATVHANSPASALLRIETLAGLADVSRAGLREQVASAFDAVVFVARNRRGTRRVQCVAELTGERGPRALREVMTTTSQGLAVVAEPGSRPWRRA